MEIASCARDPFEEVLLQSVRLIGGFFLVGVVRGVWFRLLVSHDLPSVLQVLEGQVGHSY